MTHKDMLDLFAPGSVVLIHYGGDRRITATFLGWRENGIVAELDDGYVFIPTTAIISIGVDKKES